MRRRTGQWFRRAALAVVLLIALPIALAGVALALLQTGPGRGLALRIVLDRVNLGIRGEVKVDTLEGNPPWDLTLRGVRVLDPLGREVAAADRVAVELELRALLSRTVRAPSIRVEGLSIVPRDEDGREALAAAFQPVDAGAVEPDGTPQAPAEPSAWVVDLPYLALTGRVAEHPGEKARGATDLALSAALRFERGVLSWHDLVLSATLRNVPIDRLRVATSGSLGPDGVTIDSLRADADAVSLAVHGAVRDPWAPRVDLVLDEARADLDGLARLGLVLPVRGVVMASGRVEGPAGAPSWEAKVHSARLAQADGAGGAAVTGLGVTASGSGNPMTTGRAYMEARVAGAEGPEGLPALSAVIRVRAIHGAIFASIEGEGPRGQRIDVNATAARPPPGPVSVTVVARGIDVATWARLAGIAGVGGTVGRLDADVKAERGAGPGGWEASGHVSLLAEGLRSGDVAVRELRAGLTVAGGRVLSVSGPIRARNVSLGAGRRVDELDIDVVVEAPASLAASFVARARGLTPASGVRIARADVEGRVRLAGDVPSGAMNATLRGLTLPGREMARVDAVVVVDRAGKAQVGLRATDNGLALALDAAVRLPLKGRRLAVDVTRLDMRDVASGLWIGKAGALRLDTSGAVVVEGIRIGGIEPGPDVIWMEGRYDPATGAVGAIIDADEVHLADFADRVRRLVGTASERGTGLHLDETGEARRPDIDGVAGFHLELRGTIARPVAKVGLVVREGRVKEVKDLWLTVEASADASGARLWSRARWEGASLVVDASAPVRISLAPAGAVLPADAPVRLEARLQGADLARVGSLLGSRWPGLAGRVEGTISIVGTRARPLGSARLTLKGGRLGRARDAAARVEATLGESRTDLFAALSFNDGQTLMVRGAVPVNAVAALSRPELAGELTSVPIEASLRLDGVRGGDLPVLPYVGGGVLARATLAADLRLAGTVEDPELAGWVDARSVSFGFLDSDVLASLGREGTDMIARAAVRSEEGTVAEVLLRLPGGLGRLVRGQGVAAMSKDPGLTVRVVTPALPLSVISRLSPAAGRQLATLVPAGQFAVRADVRGGKEGPMVEVALDVTSDPAAPAGVRGLAREVHVRAYGEENRTRVKAAVQQEGGRQPLRIEAEVGLGTGGAAGGPASAFPVQVRVAADDFRLEGLSAVMPQLFGPTEGALDADLAVTGTSADPRVEGTVALRFDRLDLAAIGLVQEDIEVALGVKGGMLRLEPLHLEADGSMDLELDVALPSLDAAAMELAGVVKMDGFKAVDRHDAEVKLTGELEVGGTVAGPRVQGRIRIDDASIRAEIPTRKVVEPGMPDDVVFTGLGGRPVRRSAARQEEGPAGAPAQLDIALEIPDRSIHVKNKMVELFLGGDVAIATREGVLAPRGVIRVIEGTFEMYGRKFIIQEDSLVALDGAADVNPRLEVRADYPIRDVDLSAIGLDATRDSKVTVDVTGTAREPALKLSSDPPMDETNIVSIIAMGQPVGAEEKQQRTVEQQTTNLVASMASGTISRMVESQLPIDVFQYEQTGQTPGQAQVTVGKRVSRDLLVLYRANIGTAKRNENANEIQVEYDITRRLQFQTRFGDAGQGAFDLLMRWRY